MCSAMVSHTGFLWGLLSWTGVARGSIRSCSKMGLKINEFINKDWYAPQGVSLNFKWGLNYPNIFVFSLHKMLILKSETARWKGKLLYQILLIKKYGNTIQRHQNRKYKTYCRQNFAYDSANKEDVRNTISYYCAGISYIRKPKQQKSVLIL